MRAFAALVQNFQERHGWKELARVCKRSVSLYTPTSGPSCSCRHLCHHSRLKFTVTFPLIYFYTQTQARWCTHGSATAHVRWSKDSLSVFFFYHVGSGEANSSWQAWQEAPVCAELPHSSSHLHFKDVTGGIKASHWHVVICISLTVKYLSPNLPSDPLGTVHSG